MTYRTVCAVLLAAGVQAEGTAPRQKAADYPAHAALPNLEIGAEYLSRSLPADKRTFYSDDYLVVEVAVYAPQKADIEIAAGNFCLRINGKKQTILPQAPGMVAASFKYPDWETRPQVIGTAGAGNAGVILGRPRATPRFPGDTTPETRLPKPPQSPQDNPAGMDREAAQRPEEIAVERALPEGHQTLPVSGYLYFAFRGKPASIRSLELLYQGPGGAATVRLK